jgi:hypothetical protein
MRHGIAGLLTGMLGVATGFGPRPALVSLGAPLHVVDARGVIIGPYTSSLTGMGSEGVFWKVGGRYYASPVTSQGFVSMDASQFQFYHTTTDCSGTRYDIVSPVQASALIPTLNVQQFGGTNGGAIYYPLQPFSSLLFGSMESFVSGADVGQPGTCNFLGVTSATLAGVVAVRDVSTFVPPFKVVP